MALTAFLHSAGDTASRRSSPRRLLRLHAAGGPEGSPESRVVVHDISQGGLLIESDQRFVLGDSIHVDLPEAGAVQAEVVWSSGSFVGCRFAHELPSAVVSAALLRSSPEVALSGAEAVSSAASEVRELQARIQQLLQVTGSTTSTPAPSPGPAAPVPPADPAEEAFKDDRLPFAWRMRIILGVSLGSWALILWFAGFA